MLRKSAIDSRTLLTLKFSSGNDWRKANCTSISTSYKEKQIFCPENLNQLGNDDVLLISNHGYVRTNKEGSACYKTEPVKSQYGRIIVVNFKEMSDV